MTTDPAVEHVCQVAQEQREREQRATAFMREHPPAREPRPAPRRELYALRLHRMDPDQLYEAIGLD